MYASTDLNFDVDGYLWATGYLLVKDSSDSSKNPGDDDENDCDVFADPPRYRVLSILFPQLEQFIGDYLNVKNSDSDRVRSIVLSGVEIEKN